MAFVCDYTVHEGEYERKNRKISSKSIYRFSNEKVIEVNECLLEFI